MMNCPCCGQPIDLDPPPDLRITPTERVVLGALMASPGANVPISRITHALYGDDPNGGPDDPENVIRVMVYRLRRKLGIDIQNTYGGYRINDTVA